MAADNKKSSLVLPVSVTTKVDTGRLLQEVTNVDEFMDQAAIRQPGTQSAMPKTSRLMNEVVQTNKLNMLLAEDRAKLIEFINLVRDNAPEIHMSFSTEPSPAFIHKITSYLRENIHPYALVQIGLQPTIGAGFMLRTTNKYYDFSIRTTLKAKRELLTEQIKKLRVVAEPAAVQEEV